MIIKKGGLYIVKSETSGREFGKYKTRAEAEKRIKQMEYFKNIAKPGAHTWVRKRSLVKKAQE